MCPDNPDEYRRAKGIYEKISGWNEQTETETGTGKTGCQNRKSTGKGQRKRKKTTGDEKASWKADDKQLIAQGAQLTNIQITDQNIKSFDRVARKYGIDYSLKKDSHVKPPLYLVFFKSKDVDVMTAAFKEYAGIELDQSKKKKPSVRKKLQKTQERKAKHRQRVKTKQKVRGQER